MHLYQNHMTRVARNGGTEPKPCDACKFSHIITDRPVYRLGCTHPKLLGPFDQPVPVIHARGVPRCGTKYWEQK